LRHAARHTVVAHQPLCRLNRQSPRLRLAASMLWSTLTPDGRPLVVSREGGVWAVTCGDAEPVRSDLLDIALTRALRAENNARGHSKAADYASWTRPLADRFERAAERGEERQSRWR
jgi:hypothetical protein